MEALTTVPQAGLLQIFAFIGALELWVFWQEPEREAGDIAPAWMTRPSLPSRRTSAQRAARMAR